MTRVEAICFEIMPLSGSNFGAELRFDSARELSAIVAELEVNPGPLRDTFYATGGMLVMKHLDAINQDPRLLVQLSRGFGAEVENYHATLTPERLIHDSVPEILVVSNLSPMNFEVPARPDPPLARDGGLPVQYPHRLGWHTDQSFRRPPPDVSLFYAMTPCPRGQGQTIYADGIAAYDALSPALKQHLDGLEAVHAIPWTGRGEAAVRAGETPKPLLPHQESQRQPVVRIHPVTGKPALYLCGESQLDWILGPFAGMPPGPDSAGGQLLSELMAHYTEPRFTYVDDWDAGDLVIHDNRNTIHTATWFDAAQHGRIMWRTTVFGNPGDNYAGEARSWLPEAGGKPMGELDLAMRPNPKSRRG